MESIGLETDRFTFSWPPFASNTLATDMKTLNDQKKVLHVSYFISR